MRVVELRFVKSASELNQAPPEGLPEIAFVGRSNVGKSSMINALLGRRALARVSNTPGRTRLLNFFELDLEVAPGRREKLSVCDLPGYGYAKAPRDEIAKWQQMIEGYLRGRESLRATISLIDSRHGPTEQDRVLFDWMASLGRPIVVVATKIDKLPKARRTPLLQALGRALGSGAPIGFSAETGEGKEALWEMMHTLIGELRPPRN